MTFGLYAGDEFTISTDPQNFDPDDNSIAENTQMSFPLRVNLDVSVAMQQQVPVTQQVTETPAVFLAEEIVDAPKVQTQEETIDMPIGEAMPSSHHSTCTEKPWKCHRFNSLTEC